MPLTNAMRIVSYNILDGGIGRADPLAEVILAQRPDIIALVEVDDATVLERIASRANMDFIHATAGQSGAALLSRWTIRESIDHAALIDAQFKSFLQATVVDPSGIEWPIGVIHLKGKATEEREQLREKQIQHVLSRFARYRLEKRSHLLMGDFNSNAPYQQIDPEKCNPSTRKAWQENGGQIPRRVVQTILDAGYSDSMHAFDPAAASQLGSFTTQFPGQRLDYIFTFGIERTKITKAWIEQDRLAKYASDHFPVGLEISR